MVREKGYWLVNIDSTLLLQAPKIMPYVSQMKGTISRIVHLSPEDVSIKATTTEQMSFVGREEGVVALANILIQKY